MIDLPLEIIYKIIGYLCNDLPSRRTLRCVSKDIMSEVSQWQDDAFIMNGMMLDAINYICLGTMVSIRFFLDDREYNLDPVGLQCYPELKIIGINETSKFAGSIEVYEELKRLDPTTENIHYSNFPIQKDLIKLLIHLFRSLKNSSFEIYVSGKSKDLFRISTFFETAEYIDPAIMNDEKILIISFSITFDELENTILGELYSIIRKGEKRKPRIILPRKCLLLNFGHIQ